MSERDRDAERPRVRPAGVFRKIVMTALAAGPLVAGCPPEPRTMYMGPTPPPADASAASRDAGDQPVEPVVRPMYGVEPYQPPDPGVEEYAVVMPPPRGDPGPAAEYLAPMPE